VPWVPDTGDAGDDGGNDSGMDASTDAGGDAGIDAGNLGDGGAGAWLSSFGPSGQILRAPANALQTALIVGILRGGESGPCQVTISSSDASVASVVGGSVTIDAGQTAVVVPLTSTVNGTATLTATFDGGSLQASVTMLPTVVISEIGASKGLSDNDDELVELYHPTAVDFTLVGHVLQYHSTNINAPYLNVVTLTDSFARIRSHGFFLIGVNSYTGGSEDAHSTWTGASFSSSAGTVRFGAPG